MSIDFKLCKRCLKSKARVEFQICRKAADGLQYACRPCRTDMAREYRKTERGHEVLLEGLRKYRESEKGKRYFEAYNKSEKAKLSAIARARKFRSKDRGKFVAAQYSSSEAFRLSQRKYRQSARGKKMLAASYRRLNRGRVYGLVQKRLDKLPCIMCDHFPAQAHHHDYSKPLDVTWLCSRCHAIHHREERRSA